MVGCMTRCSKVGSYLSGRMYDVVQPSSYTDKKVGYMLYIAIDNDNERG